MTMERFKISAALLALGFAASGCSMDNHDGPLTPISNPTLYSVNQPVVQHTNYVLDVNSTGSGIGDAELDRLDHWFRSLQLGYGDQVAIDGGGYADPRSRDDIARLAASYGIILGDEVPITAGAASPGSIRVIVRRATASVPGCPNWEDPQIGQSRRTSTNYGCAMNSNIAQMIGDPNDLVLGQVGADRNGATGAKAVGNYIKRVPTGSSGAVKSEGGK